MKDFTVRKVESPEMYFRKLRIRLSSEAFKKPLLPSLWEALLKIPAPGKGAHKGIFFAAMICHECGLDELMAQEVIMAAVPITGEYHVQLSEIRAIVDKIYLKKAAEASAISTTQTENAGFNAGKEN